MPAVGVGPVGLSHEVVVSPHQHAIDNHDEIESDLPGRFGPLPITYDIEAETSSSDTPEQGAITENQMWALDDQFGYSNDNIQLMRGLLPAAGNGDTAIFLNGIPNVHEIEPGDSLLRMDMDEHELGHHLFGLGMDDEPELGDHLFGLDMDDEPELGDHDFGMDIDVL